MLQVILYANYWCRYDEFFSNGAAEFTTNNEHRQNIVLTFKIDKSSLVICGTGRAFLTRAPELAEHYGDDVLSMEPLSTPAGDTDGISLPWFDTADAVMMYHFIHRDEALVRLDGGYGEGGRELKIWPAGASQNDDNLLFSVTTDLDAESDGRRVLMASTPRSPLSSSPSPIYEIRLVLLACLAPLTIIFMGAFMGVSFVVSTVLTLFFRSFWIIAFLSLVRWMYKGRPPFDEFVEEIANDLRGLAERVQDWRIGKSLNIGKDEEQPPLRDEKSDLSLAAERKDVS